MSAMISSSYACSGERVAAVFVADELARERETWSVGTAEVEGAALDEWTSSSVNGAPT